MTKNKIKSALFALFLMVLPSPLITAEIAEGTIAPSIMNRVKTVIHEYFKCDTDEGFQVKPLSGGYSASSLRIDFAHKSYVLRIITEAEMSCRVSAELYAMKKASEKGVAPFIHWISNDGYSILMDYIPGKTLTIEHSKKAEVIANLAELIQEVHKFPKNPYNAPSFGEYMEKFYIEHSRGSSRLPAWNTAIALIRQGSQELEKLGAPSVNTHGDLNPRNILMTSEALYFIDWSEGMYTDPFQDLGYLSVLMDYDALDDDLLLKNYLQRNPTVNEKKRFLIVKKMNFARLAMGGLYVSNKLAPADKEASSDSSQLREWSYYVKAFANYETLSPQFFLDLAAVAIQSACAINVDKSN